MARPRKPRKRDYAGEYARRQQLARQHGFAGYYEQRTRRTPGAERPSSEELRRRRGHAARKDFLNWIRPQNVVLLNQHISTVKVDSRGRFVRMEKLVIDERRGNRTFTIRNQTVGSLAELVREEVKRGAVMTPQPSRDQSKLLPNGERALALHDAG